MDKDFLQEYERQEIEKTEGTHSITDRLGDLKSPVFNLVTPCSTLWGQIPFSGTIIFPIRPLPERIFEGSLQISVKEIPELIQFAQETEKIQFILCDYPTNFLGFDYLAPFFEEISPPFYLSRRDQCSKDVMELYRESEIELTTLIRASSKMDYLEHDSGGDHIIKEYIIQYTWLRYLGFDEIADTFIDNFLLSPKFSTFYLETAYNMFVHPQIDPFHASSAYSIDAFQEMKKIGFENQLTGSNLHFSEIGSVLLKTITFYPESLSACKDAISRYKENDLYSVYSALDHAVKESNQDAAIEHRNELESIIENAWHDAQIVEDDKKVIKLGANVFLGTIGYCIGGLPGLMVGLGILTESDYFDQFSELIARRTAFPYLTTIYDFKTKYGL